LSTSKLIFQCKIHLKQRMKIPHSRGVTTLNPGLQKDRDHGTTGPKEGLRPISRFRQKGHFWFQLFFFLNYLTSRKAQMSLKVHLNVYNIWIWRFCQIYPCFSDYIRNDMNMTHWGLGRATCFCNPQPRFSWATLKKENLWKLCIRENSYAIFGRTGGVISKVVLGFRNLAWGPK
jgi:hypothetical protein